MNDGYRKLMFRSLKDARDIVADYNEWDEEVFEGQAPVPPQAVPQIAMLLYRSRIRARANGDGFDFPDYDDKMYE
jgi:hypothetical protein